MRRRVYLQIVGKARDEARALCVRLCALERLKERDHVKVKSTRATNMINKKEEVE
jgi:hypothetical protein